jgi:hypothetical protein
LGLLLFIARFEILCLAIFRLARNKTLSHSAAKLFSQAAKSTKVYVRFQKFGRPTTASRTLTMKIQPLSFPACLWNSPIVEFSTMLPAEEYEVLVRQMPLAAI